MAAIVAANPEKSHPDIIWSMREYTPQRQIIGNNIQLKSVLTSLINVMMAFDGDGRNTYSESGYSGKIGTVQVNISAPWSYTVTKTIVYQNEEEFVISKSLVNELLKTAHLKVEEELHENEKVDNLGLQIVVKSIMKIVANGYAINLTDKQKALDLKIIEASAILQKHLIEAITEIKARVLPEARQQEYSFMLPYYYVIDNLNQPNSSYCLVDITYEATEIGFVRDGVLAYCSHIPYGAMTLARDLSVALEVPVEETYGYLKNEAINNYLENFSSKQKENVTGILANYQEQLTELFRETGDGLIVPKKIYLHSNLFTESFFNDKITEAAKHATKLEHATYNVTSELLTKKYPPEVVAKLTSNQKDTGLIISAQFFHIEEYQSRFDQL